LRTNSNLIASSNKSELITNAQEKVLHSMPPDIVMYSSNKIYLYLLHHTLTALIV